MRDAGCLKLDVAQYFDDDRGFFTEAYTKGRLEEVGFPEIVQVNVSKSCKNTIRGLHFNTKYPQAKMLRVLQGDILDIVVDLRVGSPDYLRVQTYRLNSPENCLLVPAGYAHGFWALKETMLLYGCSDYYDSANDSGLSLTDPKFEFPWRGIFDTNVHTTTQKDLDWPLYKSSKQHFGYLPNDRFGCDAF